MKKLFPLVFLLLLPATGRAQMWVDCTGNTPGAYPTISSALYQAGFGSTIVVLAGPCNEGWVSISGAKNLSLGSVWGQRVAVNGTLQISQSQGVYLYGLDVSQSSYAGIVVSESQGVVVDSCTSSRNSGVGLDVSEGSEALIVGPGEFNFNGSGGISIGGKSVVTTNWGGGPIDISNNGGSGVILNASTFYTWGNLAVGNNSVNSSWLSGSGVQASQGSQVGLGACTGPITISVNQGGGVSVVENSQASIYPCTPGTNNPLIANNGSYGVFVGMGGQATISSVEISGNSGPAVDLYANSQAYLVNANNLHNNGNSTDPSLAGVRVDGNSHLVLRGGTIAQNSGPGILALLNSSADFTGVSFSSNTGGVIVCDSSAYMISDLVVGSPTAPGVGCRTPNNLGNRLVKFAQPPPPASTAVKTLEAKYKTLAHRK